MYRSFVVLLFVVAFASCNHEPVADKTPEAPKSSRLSILDPLFQDVVITDTFYVFGSDTEDPHYKFKGTPMDSLQVMALPYDERSSYAFNHDFDACYKFPIDASHMGLLVRTPGEYVSSTINLFVFDVDKDSVVATMDLADVFGDAGETMSYSSCIFRDKDNRLKIATHWQSAYSHSVDNENDATVEHWNRFWLVDLSKQMGDTLSKDSATIINKHPEVMARLAHY